MHSEQIKQPVLRLLAHENQEFEFHVFDGGLRDGDWLQNQKQWKVFHLEWLMQQRHCLL